MTTVQNVSSDLLASMNGAKKESASTVGEAQDRFMTLLVAQMRNQDPLNPLDNAQVTSQLAQLSTVTGIDKLNVTLQSLQDSYHASQSMQAASMIGHGVLVPGDAMQLVEGKTVFGLELQEPASDVLVSIRNADGDLVHSFNLGAMDAGVNPLTWDGKMSNGATAPDGQYTFEVAASHNGQSVSASTLAFGVVASVSTSAQGVKLNLPGIGAAGMSDVREIL